MNPSKIRERKCSTCKHYQPSPLWRKGWCRNPLLYDRNTNHLVEADSLACNRTFIDYWEPITGPIPSAGSGSTGRVAHKPRIAPSIPMEMMDARGQRVTHTGITPMAGMTAVTADDANDVLATGEQPYSEPVDMASGSRNGAQSTLELEQIDTPASNGSSTGPISAITKPQGIAGTGTAKGKAKAVKPPQRPIIFGMGRDRLLLIGVTFIVILIAVTSGVLLLSQKKGTNPGVLPTLTPAPQPTPTGFGDPTSTVPPAPTVTPVPPPPSDVIGIGGWVQATSNVIIRSDPTTAGARLGVLQNGNNAHVIDGPQEANGYTWWKVDTYDPANPSASGWCAGEFMKPIPPP